MRWSVVLQEIALEGGGLVDRATARARGVPDHAVEQEARIGRLVVVQPGTFRPAATPATPALSQRAALLAAGPDAALSHRTAATRLGLVKGFEEAIDVLVPHHRRVRLIGARVHRTLSLPDRHVQLDDGLRTTTVDRTLADLGASVRSAVVARAMEQAVIEGRTTIRRLYRLIDDHGQRGRTGIGALRAALDDWVMSDRPPDSALEVMFARLVRRAGLPAPEYQYEIRDADGFVARVDAAWPEAVLVVEVDGFHAHASAAALQHDLSRQNRLVRLGWTVLRFTWRDVVRRPAKVAAMVADTLADAGGRILGTDGRR